jgi:hypothetical protein
MEVKINKFCKKGILMLIMRILEVDNYYLVIFFRLNAMVLRSGIFVRLRRIVFLTHSQVPITNEKL